MLNQQSDDFPVILCDSGSQCGILGTNGSSYWRSQNSAGRVYFTIWDVFDYPFYDLNNTKTSRNVERALYLVPLIQVA